jgi:hypothetical protein
MTTQPEVPDHTDRISGTHRLSGLRLRSRSPRVARPGLVIRLRRRCVSIVVSLTDQPED